ncbi:hypothetical protein [Pseudomonas asiatica]|uniref:Uncharacterized protein n=1 Tax=Pseudomonas asiatica TaxID=2219225 RepID=A0A9X4HX08_9PSED|nr:hypothetical protein [Pseudomonas asiatica]MDD2109462.1 hypothetical protein [Pseudomonas asiatica]
MKVFLNERSINAQAKSPDEAMNILSTLTKLVIKSRPIAYEGKSYRTRAFGLKEIIEGVSVQELLTDSVKYPQLHLRNERGLILQALMLRPFTEDRHNSASEHILSQDGLCLKGSCLDDASESITGSLLLSAQGEPEHQYDRLRFTSSIYGEKHSFNVTEEESLAKLTWIFEHNPKHKSTPTKSDGEDIAEMDLTPQQAQKTLSNGVMVKSRVYGHHDGSWYQFHCHSGNKFHGFKIKLASNNPAHNTAKGMFDSLKYKADCGQIFVID